MSEPNRRLDVWVLASGSDIEPISLHGESKLTDHDTAEAFDRLVPGLVARLREHVTGETQ